MLPCKAAFPTSGAQRSVGWRVLVFGVPFGMDVFQRDFKFGADGLNLPAYRY